MMRSRQRLRASTGGSSAAHLACSSAARVVRSTAVMPTIGGGEPGADIVEQRGRGRGQTARILLQQPQPILDRGAER